MSKEFPAKSRLRDGFRVIFPVWLALAMALFPGQGVCQAHILRLADGNEVTLTEMVEDLRRARVVLIGEEHDNPHHHQVQLQIIQALAAAGAQVTIGLEMFRADSQPALDRWMAGDLDDQEFMRVYHDNWGGSEQYNEIFRQARKNKWPMLGLNLSREIVKQVARNGFASLSEEQLAQLPVVQCRVDEAYMEFIRRALGKHRRQDVSFVNFCEAQMLWDMVMAKNLSAYLAENPEATVVVLTGFGHAWKHAIPTQLQKLGVSNLRVVLPEMPGHVDSGNVSDKDLDYLLLGVQQGPIH
jgi:uncharacterized iron-regulated protein